MASIHPPVLKTFQLGGCGAGVSASNLKVLSSLDHVRVSLVSIPHCTSHACVDLLVRRLEDVDGAVGWMRSGWFTTVCATSPVIYLLVNILLATGCIRYRVQLMQEGSLNFRYCSIWTLIPRPGVGQLRTTEQYINIAPSP